MAAKRRKAPLPKTPPKTTQKPSAETPFDEQVSAPKQPKLPPNLFQLVPKTFGRPSDYSDYTANIICARITDGESLRTICRDENMPSVVTVFAWLRRHPDFLKLYDRSMTNRVETHIEEIIEIADDGTNDFVEKTREDGSTYIVADHEHIQRSRLRVDTRKWIASKLKPRKYGERLVQEHTGAGGGPLVVEQKNALVDRLMALLLDRAAPMVIDNAEKKA